jgi:glucoamylase
LRIQAENPFVLHWSDDEWHTVRDSNSIATALGIDYVDIRVDVSKQATLRFTFHWTTENRWEGKDYAVEVERAETGAALKKSVGG